MSDPTWPDTPPPAPPIADYPVRWPDPPPRPAPRPVAPAPSPVPPAAVPAAPFAAPPPARPGRTAGLVAVAALLVLALAATAIALGRSPDTPVAASPSTSAGKGSGGQAGTTSSTRRTAPSTRNPGLTIPGLPTPSAPSGPKATPEEIKAEVLELQRFVAERRGLSFKNDVDVQVLSAADFKARVRTEFEKEKDDLARKGRVYKALGIVGPDVDPTEAQLSLLGDGVLGFYDPATDVLVVRGERITPFWREVVVHELTHALDDQQLDLQRPDIDQRTDGSEWAYLALVEGNAKRIENDYVAQLDADDQQTLQSEMLQLGLEQMGALMSGSLTLALIQEAPYTLGEPFVRAIERNGGNAAVDRAFGDLPTTAEQILHPEKYTAREGAKEVAPPDVPGTATGDGVLGEYLTGVMLHTGGGVDNLGDLLGQLLDGQIDPSTMDEQQLTDMLGGGLTAIDTPDGWGGDRYVTYTEGSKTCIRVDWVWDTDAARRSFLRDLTTWATTDGKGKIESPGGDRVRLTRCA